jgi:membrane fusion protein, multidrug efflux system
MLRGRLKHCIASGVCWLSPLIVLLPMALGCAPAPQKKALPIRPVKTLVVTAGGQPRIRMFPGTVEAAKKVELAFQVPGLLQKLPAREGQEVAAGDLIAQLRQDEFQARLAALQGQLDQARAVLRGLQAGERPEETLRRESQVRAAAARLANARTEFRRMEQLVRTNAVSRSAFEVAETAYQVAQEDHQAALQILEKSSIAREEDVDAQEAQVRGLEGRVVEANLQLQDTSLRAPYDGVIAQRFVEEGQNVQAKAPIVRFQDVEEIEIVVDVPETVMVADIRRADLASLVAEFSGSPGLQFPVTIREISQVADPTTQTFKVRVAMEAPEDIVVLPGMTATVTTQYRRANILGAEVFVPVSALSNVAGKQSVWLVSDKGIVSPQAVKVGAPAGQQVEIVEGLEPGDRIVVAGVARLREGMEVSDLGDALGGAPQ